MSSVASRTKTGKAIQAPSLAALAEELASAVASYKRHLELSGCYRNLWDDLEMLLELYDRTIAAVVAVARRLDQRPECRGCPLLEELLEKTVPVLTADTADPYSGLLEHFAWGLQQLQAAEKGVQASGSSEG